MNRFTETAAAATAAASLTLLGLGLTPAAHADTTLPHKGKGDAIVARTLAAKPTTGWQSVIVKITGGDLTPTHKAQIRQLGGYVYRHLPIIESAAVRVPSRNLARLAALPFVARLSSDQNVRKNDEFSVQASGADVAFAQNGLTGQNVTVAILDSGVEPHKDLGDWGTARSRVIAEKDFVNPEPILVYDTKSGLYERVYDPCGHGTHVAGIIAGNGAASTGNGFYRTFYGIARKANLVSVRVLDGNGRGTVSNVIAGIQWVIANKVQHDIRVLNLSLGHPVGESYTTDPLCQAVEQAHFGGITVVCAAGNNGRLQDKAAQNQDNEGYSTAYGSIQSPANDPYVITVGAMKASGNERAKHKIATYSSRGPSRLDFVMKPDIVAPGNRVIATLAKGCYLDTAFGTTNTIAQSAYFSVGNGRTTSPGSTRESKNYFCLSGTSMATPVVAGAVALLLQKDPTLTPDTIKARLMLSADKWAFPNGNGDALTFGAGYLNIPAALASTVTASQYALSPKLTQDANGNVYIDPSTIWGNRAIWGTDSVTDLRAIWGTRAVWGSNVVVDANKAIWGSSVWADRAVWGVSTNVADLTSRAVQGE